MQRKFLLTPFSVTLSIILLQGCASLGPPIHQTIPPQTHKILFNQSSSQSNKNIPSLADRFTQIQSINPTQQPLFPLPRSTDGFAARVYLLRNATKSVDMQYYIWNDDTVGKLVFLEMIKAADRGVKIRLLLDDFGSRGMDSTILALSQNPNIEIRLFNPTYYRTLWWLNFADNFQHLQHRMHNKNIIVDNTFLIAGGRNIANAYFQDTNQKTVFADLDMLTAGTPAQQATSYFEQFWNSDSAYPVQQLVKFNQHKVDEAIKNIYAAPANPQSQAYLQEVADNDLVGSLLNGKEKFIWGKARYISDIPTKIYGLEKPENTVPGQTFALMTQPEKYINLISAYFVPEEKVIKQLVDLQKSGIKIRILTNSLASTDAFAVYSFYAPLRKPLLKGGVEIYEFRPDQFLPTAVNGKWVMKRQDHGALHGKVYQWDEKNAFVGSFNLDPRSLKQNTEDGILLESEAIAGAINTSLDAYLSTTAYKIVPKKGAPEKVIWVQNNKEDQTIYQHAPKTNIVYRFVAWFVGLIHPLKEYV